MQTLALPLGYVAIWESGAKDLAPDILCGAGDGARTRYLHLGKVALYQMSYARRTWCIIADIFAGVKGEFLYLGLGAF